MERNRSKLIFFNGWRLAKKKKVGVGGVKRKDKQLSLRKLNLRFKKYPSLIKFQDESRRGHFSPPPLPFLQLTGAHYFYLGGLSGKSPYAPTSTSHILSLGKLRRKKICKKKNIYLNKKKQNYKHIVLLKWNW